MNQEAIHVELDDEQEKYWSTLAEIMQVHAVQLRRANDEGRTAAEYREEIRRYCLGLRADRVLKPASLSTKQAQRERQAVYDELRAEFPERFEGVTFK